MNKEILCMSLALTILAVSCRKSGTTPVNPDPNPNPVIGKIAKMEYTDGAYDSIYYNSDGTIRKVKNHFTTPALYDAIYLFDYDATGKLKRITDNNGEYYDYVYISGQLTAVNHYATGVKSDYRIYGYLNGKLADIEEYYRLGINTPAYDYVANRKLSYYPDGNLKQEINYSFDPVTRVAIKDFTLSYADYDGKLNPSDELGRFLYQAQVGMSKNNARKLITKDEVNSTTTEFNFEYTYNDFSNPLTKKITYTSGGQLHTETIKYDYY